MPNPAEVPERLDEEDRVVQLLQRLGPRREAILFAVGAAMLLVNVAILAWTSQQAQSQAQWANHSLEVQNKLSDLLLLLRRAESEQRAYILVGPSSAANTTYRASYVDAITEIPDKMAEIAAMISDNPEQTARLAALEPVIREKLENLALKVRLVEAGDKATAVALFLQDNGRDLMMAIKEGVAHMCAEEQGLLTTRSANSARASKQLMFVGMADSLVILLLGWLAISFSLRTTRSLEAANAALEAKVEERVAELREANDELQSFAYIVGHDLRAPLVNIMGFTSELETLRGAVFEQLGQRQAQAASNGKPLDEKAAQAEFDEAIGFIKAATAKMEGLISAILALSRAGKRELKPETIDMSALVNGVVTTLAHEAQSVGAEIEVGTLPAITSDRLALEQVFTNLLDNALKYLRPEEPGRIQVTGFAASGRLIYEVRDNGRGIAEADQKRVFELFRRAGAQDQRGEGIGLAHVRAMVRRLGGTIKLTSALNKGSTFRVVLPRIYRDQ